jgi:hypothetical protein
MDKNIPFCVSSISLSNQRFRCFLWDPNFHHSFYNSPSFITILSRINPFPFLPPHLSEYTLLLSAHLVLTSTYAVHYMFCLKLLCISPSVVFDECYIPPLGTPFFSSRHFISDIVEVITNSIILQNVNKKLIFHVLSKATRLFFEQFLSWKLNNICFDMLRKNSNWECVNLRIMFKPIKDKYLKIIYSINKNILYGDHVTLSLLPPVCNLISTTMHFIGIFISLYDFFT